MTIQIWQNFYQRTMPLFTPQAERFLEAIQPARLNSVAFRYTFSVEAMTKISYIIEDTVMGNPRVADTHVSFQYFSRLIPQTSRYRNIASAAKHLWLYGAYDVPTTSLGEFIQHPTTTLIDTEQSPLLNYWYLVAYGPGVFKTLLAQEIPALSGDERYYEGFYTFQPNVAYQMTAILHQLYPEQIPTPMAPELLS